MELRQIRYFVTVAEAGSLTRAATQLHISQPALTENIKNLEEELGGKLFFRNRSGMILTEIGVAFLAYASSLLNLANQAISIIKDAQDVPVGRVTFMFPASIGGLVAGELFNTASKLFPGIELRLMEFTTDFAEQIFAANLCDFVVTFDHSHSESFHVKLLLKEQLFLATKFRSKQQSAQLEFGKLGQYPIMAPHKHRGVLPILMEIAKTQEVDLQVSANSAPFAIILRMAEMGYTNLISPYSAIKEMVKEKKLSAYEIINPKIYRQINIVWPKDKPLSNSAEKIMHLASNLIINQGSSINLPD